MASLVDSSGEAARDTGYACVTGLEVWLVWRERERERGKGERTRERNREKEKERERERKK